MYGFQKRSDRPQTQKLADGGEVTRLGFKSKAQQEREQAAQAGSGPVRGPGTGTSDAIKATVPPGTYIMPADSTRAMGAENLAGLGFHPKARAMAPQGEGPKLGFKPGGKVPVNLSNGEFQLSPEQVHAIGAQVLDQMKGATHKQVEQDDEQVATDALYFANGGLVEDERMRRTSTGKIPLESLPTQDPGRTSSGSIGGQDLPYKDMQRVSFGKIGDQPIPNDAFGDLAKPAQAPAGATAKPVGFVAGAFPNTSMAIQSSFDSVRDAQKVGGAGAAVGQGFRSAMTPVVGFADDVATGAKRLLDGPAQALKTFATGDATPIGQDVVAAPAKPTPAAPASALTAAAPTASAVSPDAKPGDGMNPTPPNSGPVPYTVTPVENTNGVQRINQPGKSPLFTNIDPGQAVAEMKGNPIGIVPAGVNPFGRYPGSGGADVSAALQAAAERGDWTAIQNHYQKGGGTWQGQTAEQSARDSLIRELTPGKNGATRQQGELLTSLLNTGQELALRQQDLQGRQGIANEDLGLRREAQGFQTAAQRQVQALQQQMLAEQDPTKRNELARQLTVMQGKAPPKPDNELAKARVSLITELGKQYGASTPYGKDNKPIPFETWAEPMLRAAGMVPTDPRQREGVMLRGKDGKMYRVQNGEPVLVDALSGGAA
jgi:hypothetical protein